MSEPVTPESQRSPATPPDALHWLALAKVPGVGYKTYLALLNHFHGPREAFEAGDGSWTGIEGVRGKPQVGGARDECLTWAQKQLDQLQESRWSLIVFGDRIYPDEFAPLHNPPPFFFLRGALPAVPRLAVVGSRRATDYGRRVCGEVCETLAASGICIVSGMALGIDTIAHEAALHAGGTTVAVWGTGPDKVYPDDNVELSECIAEGGALITEFPFGTSPKPGNFPVRNRLIAALAQGVLVAQAADKSGALITAREALEQGRDVYAIPGEIGSHFAAGANALIQQGAKLVSTPDDILADYGLGRGTPGRPPGATALRAIPLDLPPFETRVLEALGESTCHIDRLAASLAESVGTVSAALLSLELKGLVRQTAGKQFHRC